MQIWMSTKKTAFWNFDWFSCGDMMRKKILLDLALLYKCSRAEPVLYILCKIVRYMHIKHFCWKFMRFENPIPFWILNDVCIALCKHYYSAVMLRDFLMIYTLHSYVTYCKSTISANWNILLLLFSNFLFEE